MTELSTDTRVLLYLKSVLILFAAVCNQRVSKRPNPPPDETEQKVQRDKEGKHLDLIGSITIAFAVLKPWFTMNYCVALCDAYVTLCYLHPSLQDSLIYPLIVRNIHGHPQFTITYLLGCIIVFAATYLRLLCFRTLGKFFTFELAIRRNHQLCTDGPYAVVRHPSYTALMATYVGVLLCCFSSGSVWQEYRLGETAVGQVIKYAWAIWLIMILTGYLKRVKTEDMMLKENFGEEWVRWYKKTPYRLIPYVY